MPTALSGYTTVTNATFGSARQLAPSASGTAAAVATTIAKRTGWHFLMARGGTSQSQAATGSALSAIPPDVFGFLWEVTTLEGQRLAAGSVAPAVRVQASSVLISGKVAVRYWKRSSAGVFTAIGATQEAAATAFTTTALTRTLPAVTLAETDFAAGDQLYVEVFVDVTSNSANSNSATVSIVEAGTTSPTAFPTAGYDPTPAPVNLTVQGATHAHTATSPSLTQQHQLDVAGATHAHQASSPALTQQHELGVTGAVHAHTADAVTLTVAVTLAVADGVHGHTADSVMLTVAGSLTVDDAVHQHTADQVALTTVTALAVTSAVHQHTATEVALGQVHELAVDDVVHGHAATAVTLAVTVTLTLADAVHGHVASVAVLVLVSATVPATGRATAEPATTSTGSCAEPNTAHAATAAATTARTEVT